MSEKQSHSSAARKLGSLVLVGLTTKCRSFAQDFSQTSPAVRDKHPC